ncbi:hypothetical protein BC936DRAFT_140515 [Jimgerdemannia flammicorona]|uniref:Uncharacterized protein n=1 Tax=Jimgerdemannia flammicorona TaxID=994334 RepID=A0A433ASG3_9FUNG|nr:hypothetical protein BC936DRAFT_140515 [Jimgerdemannia flammicorona]
MVLMTKNLEEAPWLLGCLRHSICDGAIGVALPAVISAARHGLKVHFYAHSAIPPESLRSGINMILPLEDYQGGYVHAKNSRCFYLFISESDLNAKTIGRKVESDLRRRASLDLPTPNNNITIYHHHLPSPFTITIYHHRTHSSQNPSQNK